MLKIKISPNGIKYLKGIYLKQLKTKNRKSGSWLLQKCVSVFLIAPQKSFYKDRFFFFTNDTFNYWFFPSFVKTEEVRPQNLTTSGFSNL